MTTYRPQHTYIGVALVSLIVACLFGWELLRDVETGIVLFFAVSIGVLLWSLRVAATTVLLNQNTLTVRTPLAKPREIAYQQMLSVSEEGRLGKVIVVAYHPRSDSGMLDLDAARIVELPSVQDQDALYETLLDRVPA